MICSQMGDVLPLYASPRTAASSCEKGRQRSCTDSSLSDMHPLTFLKSPSNIGKQALKTVVSFFKTFRWAWPSKLGGPPNGNRPLVVGVDVAWWCFSSFPFALMVLAFVKLMVVPIIFIFGGLIFHVLVLYSVVYWHQNMPFRLMGAKAKFMIEVIPMITAAALRHLLGYNYCHIFLLLSCTAYFYIYAHFLHIAYDIGVIDVLLGIAMQVLVQELNVELLVRASVLSFCIILCLYRYMTYCAPELPVSCKKDLEQLPC